MDENKKTQIAAVETSPAGTSAKLTVMLEDERIVDLDFGDLLGPGVWRRVLTKLEEMNIEDRNHVLRAWDFGLIGEWHY